MNTEMKVSLWDINTNTFSLLDEDCGKLSPVKSDKGQRHAGRCSHVFVDS